MRLLNTETLQLEEFFDSQVPQYAILSHCWGVEEVTFSDINDPSWRGKQGAKKILDTCDQCKRQLYRYVWIDTCCIDKSSSAELSEAINSMFRWYQQSAVCFTLLEDVTWSMTNEFPHFDTNTFRESRWFTRGWTLQELIAPQDLHFFDSNWRLFGHRWMLSKLISEITRIPEFVLKQPNAFGLCSIASRMSWAAGRCTTRVEDMAYSLLGIFNVNMPLLYGEGTKSFIRLQEEILKETVDQSILAWEVDGDYPKQVRGVLAESPNWFAGCGDIIPILETRRREPYLMTNQGLRITLLLKRYTSTKYTDTESHIFYEELVGTHYVALLACQYENDFSSSIYIPLTPSPYPNVFFRTSSRRRRYIDLHHHAGFRMTEIYITKRPMIARNWTESEYCILSCESLEAAGFELVEVIPGTTLWNEKARTLQILPNPLNGHLQKVAFKFLHRIRNSNIEVLLFFKGEDNPFESFVSILSVDVQSSDLTQGHQGLDTQNLQSSHNIVIEQMQSEEGNMGRMHIYAEVKKKEVLNQMILVLELSVVTRKYKKMIDSEWFSGLSLTNVVSKEVAGNPNTTTTAVPVAEPSIKD